MQPLVSIIICNYNYGAFIRNAIESALNQTYSTIEVIVVDDGSTDNSHEIINDYVGKIVPSFKENGGQASAFNEGFAASHGDIICLLDSDDTFDSHKVTEVVKAFENHQEAAWCFHSLREVEIKTNQVLKTSSPGHPSRVVDFRESINKKGERPVFAPATSACSFKRSLLDPIFPLPKADSIEISDNYIKFACVALSQGFYLNESLSTQGIHSHNLYTQQSGRKVINVKVDMTTAYWLRKNFPNLKHFSNRLFRTGLANYWLCHQTDEKILIIIKNYFEISTLLEKAQILLVASLHYTNLTSKIQQFKALLPKKIKLLNGLK